MTRATRLRTALTRRLLIVEDNGSEREWDGVEEVGVGDRLQEEYGVAELSMNSMVGISSPRTLKLKGDIKGTPVVVMVDCGATHNFVSESLVKSIPIQVESTGGYGIITGTGITVRSQGCVREFTSTFRELISWPTSCPWNWGALMSFSEFSG